MAHVHSSRDPRRPARPPDDPRLKATRKRPGDYGKLKPPAELARYGNGRVPTDALEPIGRGSHRLYGPAAQAFKKMAAAAKAEGVDIGVTDSYRSLDEQEDLARRKGLFSQGGLAAEPGTSNHGWGMALDLDLNPKAQQWMRANGPRFGFVEDTPREPWHWAFRPDEAQTADTSFAGSPVGGGGSTVSSAGGTGRNSPSSGGGFSNPVAFPDTVQPASTDATNLMGWGNALFTESDMTLALLLATLQMDMKTFAHLNPDLRATSKDQKIPAGTRVNVPPDVQARVLSGSTNGPVLDTSAAPSVVSGGPNVAAAAPSLAGAAPMATISAASLSTSNGIPRAV